MPPDSDRIRLRHMIDAANQALEYAEGRTRHDVEAEPPLRHLLIRNIEIMGEAASRITPELQKAYPEIPWHTVRQALPTIVPRLKALLEHLEEDY